LNLKENDTTRKKRIGFCIKDRIEMRYWNSSIIFIITNLNEYTMKNLILDSIKDFCNENYNWFDYYINSKGFEIYDGDFNVIAVVDFEVEVEVYRKPCTGNYFNPPETGECDFILFEINVIEVYNSKGKLLPNYKEKVQNELDNVKGKII
jgi:hypothetical protein